MSNTNHTQAIKYQVASEASLRNAHIIMNDLRDAIASGEGVEVDCSAVAHADITIVQTLISAQRSCAARSVPFALTGLSEVARCAFVRAGVTPPAPLLGG